MSKLITDKNRLEVFSLLSSGKPLKVHAFTKKLQKEKTNIEFNLNGHKMSEKINSDKAISSLQYMIKILKPTKLDLSGNMITEKQISKIVNAVKYSTITDLNLSNNRIMKHDEVIDLLTTHTKVKKLIIGNNTHIQEIPINNAVNSEAKSENAEDQTDYTTTNPNIKITVLTPKEYYERTVKHHQSRIEELQKQIAICNSILNSASITDSYEVGDEGDIYLGREKCKISLLNYDTIESIKMPVEILGSQSDTGQ